MCRYQRFFLIQLLATGFWIGACEYSNGSISSIYGFYCCDYRSKITGEIITSKLLTSGRGSTHNIEYSYVFGGITYTSNKVRFSTNSTDVAADTVRKYPVGIIKDVYIDPDHPQSSVLELSKPEGWLWVQVCAAIIMSIFTTWHFYRSTSA